MHQSIFVSVLICLLRPVTSRQQYQQCIPNGDQVPHPCNRNQCWAGVGHQNPAGGGTPNDFGKDFYMANLMWTDSLCRADSDGDGKTNGQELGDPFCLWQPGMIPTVTDSSQLSHPGVCEPLNSPRCASKNQWLPSECCPQPKPQPLRQIWTTTTPACDVPSVFCIPPARMPSNSYILNVAMSTPEHYVPGDYIHYECNVGFERSGAQTVYCLRDGSWSDAPSCQQTSFIARLVQACPSPCNGR